MDGEIIASGLEFPEGPVWVDGALVLHRDRRRRDHALDGRRRTRCASPTPAAGRTGPRSAPTARCTSPRTAAWPVRGGRRPASSGSTLDGEVTMVTTEVDGLRARRSQRPRVRRRRPPVVHRSPRRARPGRQRATPVGCSPCDPATGDGELILEVGPVFPNGIAFLADGTLVWTESFTRRVHAARRRDARARDPAARAPRPRRPVRRRRRPALRGQHVRPLRQRRRRRRDRRPARVRRRHADQLLLRRHRPLRHRVPPRHAVALRARRRGPPAALPECAWTKAVTAPVGGRRTVRAIMGR